MAPGARSASSGHQPWPGRRAPGGRGAEDPDDTERERGPERSPRAARPSAARRSQPADVEIAHEAAAHSRVGHGARHREDHDGHDPSRIHARGRASTSAASALGAVVPECRPARVRRGRRPPARYIAIALEQRHRPACPNRSPPEMAQRKPKTAAVSCRSANASSPTAPRPSATTPPGVRASVPTAPPRRPVGRRARRRRPAALEPGDQPRARRRTRPARNGPAGRRPGRGRRTADRTSRRRRIGTAVMHTGYPRGHSSSRSLRESRCVAQGNRYTSRCNA